MFHKQHARPCQARTAAGVNEQLLTQFFLQFLDGVCEVIVRCEASLLHERNAVPERQL